MNALSGAARLAAAVAAVGINVLLAGGLIALAGHYAERAADGPELAGRGGTAAGAQASAVRCTPERMRAG